MYLGAVPGFVRGDLREGVVDSAVSFLTFASGPPPLEPRFREVGGSELDVLEIDITVPVEEVASSALKLDDDGFFIATLIVSGALVEGPAQDSGLSILAVLCGVLCKNRVRLSRHSHFLDY